MSGKGFDTRKLMTGKDGKLFVTVDGTSVWFASVEEFAVGVNFSNVDFHPAGDIQTYGVPDSVKFTASFTEAVVRDDLTIQPMLDSIKNGKRSYYGKPHHYRTGVQNQRNRKKHTFWKLETGHARIVHLFSADQRGRSDPGSVFYLHIYAAARHLRRALCL